MEPKDFLSNFTGNLASDTVEKLFKRIMELKHSRDNYHQFRDTLNVMRSHLLGMQSSSSQYHTLVSPDVERCTNQLIAVLEEAKTRFPEDLPSFLASLTLHSNMESVNVKLEAGFKELKWILEMQDLISKTALLQPPKPLMQPEPETGFVGNEFKTLEKRMRELIRDDNPARIIVVHGQGGVGKTTLLHKVYNSVIEESTVFSFSSMSWLTISQEYNVAKLQRTLAKDVGMGMQVKDIEDEERLKMMLFDSFKTRRFFVVLDDLWSEEFDVRKLGLVFGNGNQGSKVVITTRNMTVDRNMGDPEFTEHIAVPTLNEGDSWEMFRRWCFGSLDTGSVSGETLKTAEAVCKECKGLPLAIKVVAASFRLRVNVDDQKSFLTQLKMADPVFVGIEQRELFSKLKLSYDSLPFPDLKKCFLYTACMFAEDAHIRISKLIRMWICEGFVRCEYDHDFSLQQGIYYFKILYYRCLISNSPDYVLDLDDECNLLNYTTIKVHDCVRDMAMIVGKEDAFISDLSSAGNFKRLSLQRSSIPELPSKFPHSNMISLNLSQTRISKVPNDFFTQLFSLKVLDLSHTSIDSLPSSILDLSNLELLDLCGCFQLSRLPEELGNLVKLRFLDIEGTSIHKFPSSLVNLTALKVLRMLNSIVHVPKSIARLISLEVLHIWCHKLDFKVLTEFPKLQRLVLKCDSIELDENSDIDWRCCRQLKDLSLHISKIPSKIFENMVQLQRLELIGLNETDGFLRLPNLENFPNLKRCAIFHCRFRTLQIPKTMQQISIFGCREVEQLLWPDDCCALKRLCVRHCLTLKSVGIGKGTHLKCLEGVTLDNLPSLEELGEEQDHWNRDTFPALHTFDIRRIGGSETCRQRLENLKRILSLE